MRKIGYEKTQTSKLSLLCVMEKEGEKGPIQQEISAENL